ncbi:hypothetical protein C8J56DRAFT_17512 [Mycena floridula]|nr:hypothetical protein C8J56DRAFT_17512 [Mycena floridula]
MEATEAFPELPTELVLLIIETLLEMEPKRALDLISSLSQDVKPIAEQALYRCITLEDEISTDLFVDMIRSRCRADTFYQSHVRTLCLAVALEIPDLILLLSASSGVTQLGISNWYRGKSSIPEVDAYLDTLLTSGARPSKLSCDLRWGLYPRIPGTHRFAFPFFQNVTHLEIYNFEHARTFEAKQLHSLTNLTHLSILLLETTESRVLTLLHTLSLPDSILACIIFMDGLDFVDPLLSESKDPRVVFALFDDKVVPRNFLRRNLLDPEYYFVKQWGRLDKDEMDVWEEAERVVKVQRAELELTSQDEGQQPVEDA